MSRDLVLTCEHATAAVPDAYAPLFASPEAQAALATHRGWDVGALFLARAVWGRLGAPLFAATATRLLIDFNRSETHPRLFSAWSRTLPEEERTALLETTWRVYRRAVESEIQRRAERGVMHVSVHTFTPVLGDAVRRTDIGLLYDPSRPAERLLCARWKAGLAVRLPTLAIHRNAPYKGVSDGHTTALRTRFPDPAYAGIELEINQRLVDAEGHLPPALTEAIIASLADTVA